jgi:CBS domain-containing protein
MMVVESQEDKHVVGLSTSRDLLRIIAAGLRDLDESDVAGAAEVLNTKIGDFMTPISQVIFARPDESVGMCRTIMAKLGIKCIPILSREGRVEGLITARDMSDYGLEAEERGGKKSYLRDISERVGLSSNTSMAEPPSYLQAHLALEQSPLFANVGVAELPHPFKTDHGVGADRRGKELFSLAHAPRLNAFSNTMHLTPNILIFHFE